MYGMYLCIFVGFTVHNRRKGNNLIFPENEPFYTTHGDWALLVELN